MASIPSSNPMFPSFKENELPASIPSPQIGYQATRLDVASEGEEVAHRLTDTLSQFRDNMQEVASKIANSPNKQAKIEAHLFFKDEFVEPEPLIPLKKPESKETQRARWERAKTSPPGFTQKPENKWEEQETKWARWERAKMTPPGFTQVAATSTCFQQVVVKEQDLHFPITEDLEAPPAPSSGTVDTLIAEAVKTLDERVETPVSSPRNLKNLMIAFDKIGNLADEMQQGDVKMTAGHQISRRTLPILRFLGRLLHLGKTGTDSKTLEAMRDFHRNVSAYMKHPDFPPMLKKVLLEHVAIIQTSSFYQDALQQGAISVRTGDAEMRRAIAMGMTTEMREERLADFKKAVETLENRPLIFHAVGFKTVNTTGSPANQATLREMDFLRECVYAETDLQKAQKLVTLYAEALSKLQNSPWFQGLRADEELAQRIVTQNRDASTLNKQLTELSHLFHEVGPRKMIVWDKEELKIEDGYQPEDSLIADRAAVQMAQQLEGMMLFRRQPLMQVQLRNLLQLFENSEKLKCLLSHPKLRVSFLQMREILNTPSDVMDTRERVNAFQAVADQLQGRKDLKPRLNRETGLPETVSRSVLTERSHQVGIDSRVGRSDEAVDFMQALYALVQDVGMSSDSVVKIDILKVVQGLRDHPILQEQAKNNPLIKAPLLLLFERNVTILKTGFQTDHLLVLEGDLWVSKPVNEVTLSEKNEAKKLLLQISQINPLLISADQIETLYATDN